MMFDESLVAKALRAMVSPPQGSRLAELVIKNDAKSRSRAFRLLSHLDTFEPHAVRPTPPSRVFDDVVALARTHGLADKVHVISEIADVNRTVLSLAEIRDVMTGDGRVSLAVIQPMLAVYQGESFHSTLLLHVAVDHFRRE
ncbi:hypothetical protein IFT79_13360 [Frigoribacterium sp. CFBP 8759]|uniref:hypothetical protein n=1 Tax=Frigoribacterium sp. CFBP 8759 TaxID=2775283 RepID=UPI001786C246|nr:hypothetical protein [Frigoribacterium sp. CFBP 8759]MBD8486607.1 hypothetical protein [Frigoribacterium sp. CFBP 8759]